MLPAYERRPTDSNYCRDVEKTYAVLNIENLADSLPRIALFASDAEYQNHVRVIVNFPSSASAPIDESATAMIRFREWESSFARNRGLQDASEVAAAFSTVAAAIVEEARTMTFTK